VNAGHLPPLLYDPKRGTLQSLDKGCIGMGMLDVIPTVEVGKVRIPRNAKLLAFTDGLIELERDDKITSGLMSVEKIISNPHGITENINEVKNYITKHVNLHAVFDDISVIGIGFDQ
jgi:sigma-B regulation protein RsbU (phosphoserine phosphatase)